MSRLRQIVHNRSYFICLSLLLSIFVFVLLSIVPQFAFSTDFTARCIGSYGDIAVMEVNGNYDALNADGTVNAESREIIAGEFFKLYQDVYDFIIVFSNFDFMMPNAQAKAFYLNIKNDVKGIGIPVFDNSSLFGSGGKLQGMVDMGNSASSILDPLDENFEKSLSIFGHEIMHRWGAYVKFKNTDGTASTELLSSDKSHWSFLLDSYGSVLYGNKWKDNGNGTFTSIAGRINYSPLDLYLMGLADKTQVPPMLIIDNTEINPDRMSEVGATIAGTARYVTIDDIIAAEGERVPGASDAQRTFRAAFVLVTRPGTFTESELYGIEVVRDEWARRFSILTDGEAIVQVGLRLKENIPDNPGPGDPPIVPRTLPADIMDGVKWLMANQKTDGSWFDLLDTAQRDTAESVGALRNFTIAQQQYSTGATWLAEASSGNTDFLSRRIEVLKSSGRNADALVSELMSKRNNDGGWGSDIAYTSNSVDTAFALRALSSAGYSDYDTVSTAVEYLKAKQNPDGGWGREDGSDIDTTANVLSAFNKYSEKYQLQEPISNGLAWLGQKQNPDGGFGNSPSTVYDTATAILALQENGGVRDTVKNGVNYILSRQSKDGSWYLSVHQTALAVAAVWASTVVPDLTVKTQDIVFVPSTVATLPADIAVHVKIGNLGRTDVAGAKIALYEGALTQPTIIAEQTAAISGLSSVDLIFPVTITDAGEHRYIVKIDPDNIINEQNKANNIAYNIIKPASTYDLEILSSNINISPNPVDITNDVKILSKLTNKGTLTAYNVQVRYYVDDAGAPIDIAIKTIDIPANTTVPIEVTWTASKAGSDMPLTVWVDPLNAFTEVSKTNNKASTPLTVNGSTDPNLTVSYKDITVIPATPGEQGNANISALVRNGGFSAADNVGVNFYKGVSGTDGVLIGSRTIPSLNPGESHTVSVDWSSIQEAGERILSVRVDPDNLIKETKEDDNDAFITVKIQSLPDLAISTNSIEFSPSVPKSGDTVSIKATVKNLGEQSVTNVPMKALEGGSVIGVQSIPSISGNSQAQVTFTYTAGDKGAHQITIVVDPDNAVVERSKSNNAASKSLGIQDANLWLTEPYISPNGDGIKDSTQFFFRLNEAQTVRVTVENEKGEVVKTFSGGMLNYTKGEGITWEGLDEKGVVVGDGPYRLNILDEKDELIGSLTVIVDNNRSPLRKAIGTKFLQNNNLTCMLPDIYDLEWFPDESGLVVYVDSTDESVPEYPKGIYTISPDGEDITRIVPWQWSNDPDYYYFMDYHKLSPDGERVVFSLEKVSKKDWKIKNGQLWIVDRDGRDLRLLDSYDAIVDIRDLVWINKNGILYKVMNQIWLIRPDGTGKTNIDTACSDYDHDFYYLDRHSISPEGTRIAYLCDGKIRTNDMMGNRQDIVELNKVNSIKWLNEQTLVAFDNNYSISAPGELWLFDVSEAKNHIKLSEIAREFAVSPDQTRVAYIENNQAYSSVMLADGLGNITVLYHEPAPGNGCDSGKLVDLRWSPDSEKIAFSASSNYHRYKDYPQCDMCESLIDIVVVHINSKSITRYFPSGFNGVVLPDSLPNDTLPICAYYDVGHHVADSMIWLSDNLTLGFYDTEMADLYSVWFMDIIDGKLISIPNIFKYNLYMSPKDNYITYTKPVDESSVCQGRGSLDIWAMSSLLNLVADLRLTRDKSAIILKGVAADLNFEGYSLEYADASDPNVWNLVQPSSDVPVLNDVFTTWVPPHEGKFYVKLTVWDRAGNVKWDRKPVSWGLSSAITNLYKNLEIFSPNGDGVKDLVELHYRALDPVHLEFNIYDKNNNIVRTYLRDHVSPVDDFIAWDGRDEHGSVVPEGKYKIRVFDYEFFVVVDNKIPDVDISLSEMKYESREGERGERYILLHYALNGHVFDDNLNNWVIEYGKGDSPQQWYKFMAGKDILVERDDNGIIKKSNNGKCLNTEVETIGQNIEWLIDAKFRITSDDFAGNKAAVTTDLIKQEIIPYKWDNIDIDGSILPENLTRPALHRINVMHAIRRPIVSINIQYWNGEIWIDTPETTYPSSRDMILEWDNSTIDSETVLKVRIKAIDELYNEYYSKEIRLDSSFGIGVGCSKVIGYNYVLEKLSTLRYQLKSLQDADFPDWTDFTVYSTADGEDIPEGRFELPSFLMLWRHQHYELRMIGTIETENGSEYLVSKEVSFPPDCYNGKDDTGYPKAICNMLQTMATFGVDIFAISGRYIEIISLDYFIEKQSGAELLNHFEHPWTPLPKAYFSTESLSDGLYNLKGVVKYRDSEKKSEELLEIPGELIVDRTFPSARITYPTSSTRLCSIKVTDQKGDWYGIPVEIIATDNTGVRLCNDAAQDCGIELYYGFGENPEHWNLALTRKSGEATRITHGGDLEGLVGILDLTGIGGSTITLQLRVTDIVGNTSCSTTTLSMDDSIEILNLSSVSDVISPNGDMVADKAEVSYQIIENTIVDHRVFKVLEQSDGSKILDGTAVRTLATGLTQPGGVGYAVWDGKNDSGAVVPDGVYGVAVSAKDSCGNPSMKWIDVAVDTTPPTAVITYPQPSDALSSIVEVKGSTEDLHFSEYTLESGEGESPARWNFVSSGLRPVRDNMLGRWNTSELNGKQTLRLTARDSVGNSKIATTTVNLAQRKTLIKDLSATPVIFSPNNDGRVDTTSIKYELSDACGVKIEMVDSASAVRKTYTTNVESAGIYTYTWDGRDSSGVVVPDESYSIRVTAALSSNSEVSQSEAITVTVDRTPPTVDITGPQNNAYFRSDVSVLGTLSDLNLVEYSIRLSGDAGVTVIDEGNQKRKAYSFGVLSDLAEGKYSLTAEARDAGENKTRKETAFTIDKTSPNVTLDTPKSGEYYGSSKNVVNMAGSIVEKNLDTYSLQYGPGDDPQAWTVLWSGSTVPTDPRLFSWKVGKHDGIADGVYTVWLSAKDKVDLTGEARVTFTIDNTPPTVAITAPKEGGFIKSAVEVQGTASDTNLEKYTLEISGGQCGSAFQWATLKTSSSSVQDGVLALWQTLPPEGEICLRLSAVDKMENKSEAKVQIRVDATPPTRPVLSGKKENRTDAVLTWSVSPEPDTAGYNIYRGVRKINAILLKDTTYVDGDLQDGSYTYTATAVDYAGNESKPSNEIPVKIDTKGPDAKVRSPLEDARVGGFVDLKGTAYSTDDFKQYRVSIGQGSDPSAWSLLVASPVPVSYGSLAQWDTVTIPDGPGSIKLEAEDLDGNVTSHRVKVTVDNTAPAAPVLLTATANGSDVTVTWRANGENDLAGYLLYRNEELANAKGFVSGNLKPYLISATAYVDKAAPDGKHKYTLVAMDQAGNTSDESNAIEVEIDTHPPHTVITEPLDGSKLRTRTLVRAESSDRDIASVRFQYKGTQDAAWTDLGGLSTGTPFTTYFDSVSLGLNYGDYNLRAVATDRGGNTDPAPASITVTYTDPTAPDPPGELKASTNGRDVTLTWRASTETDLDGYNIYRSQADEAVKVNSTVVKEASYQDNGLNDGEYAYVVTAVDTHGNESEPSATVSSKIFAPLLSQPYTPSVLNTIQVAGVDAGAGATVDIFTDTGAGSVLQGTAPADGEGEFTAPSVSLGPGENRVTARAKDGAGNISRMSDAVYVVFNEPPAPPTGLAASALDKDVSLTWNPNSEPDLAGYNLYRNGGKINVAIPVESGSVTASFSQPNTPPPAWAFDGDPETYWASPAGEGSFNPAWWEIDLPAPQLINHVEIYWVSQGDGEKLYAGKDFEIQVWSGHAWITRTRTSGNSSKESLFDFNPPYGTDKIRIFITDTTDMSSSKQVMISEVKLLKDDLIPHNNYSELNIHDGRYSYSVTAMDTFGLESTPSDSAEVPVGDVVGPSTPVGLTATASGSDILLEWSVNPETDLAGYNIYRKKGSDWEKLGGSPVAGSTYTDAGLVNGTYIYRITAVDRAENESPPSNEARATVFVEPLPSPMSLTVSSVPEGGALKASWQYAGPAVSGYTVYRGTSSGGPYTKANSSKVGATTFTDTGLTNGVTYYYVVAAADGAGNESAYSNEASGTPTDNTPPGRPSLTYPALPGLPVRLVDITTDISGSAEPGSTVELFEGGTSLYGTTALMENMTRIVSPGSGEYLLALSPDGKTFAYWAGDGSLWIRDMATGNSSWIADGSGSVLWASDLKTLLYTYVGSDWYQRIGLYDIVTGNKAALTDDAHVHETNLSISADGARVVFISNRAGSDDVWLKDLSDGSLTQMTTEDSVSDPQISPDAKMIAYRSGDALKIINIANMAVIEVDTETDGDSFSWSPDGKRLAYGSSRYGYADILIYNVDSQDLSRFSNSPNEERNPVWSPDGKLIAYFMADESDKRSIAVLPASGEGEAVFIPLKDNDYGQFAWIKSGEIVYKSQNNLKAISLKGRFVFNDVRLETGENTFRAVAHDSQGNTSQFSEEIHVVFDGSSIPDPAVSEEGLFIYPPYPKDGDQVKMYVTVENRGHVDVSDVDVSVYLFSGSKSELLKSRTIPVLGADSSEIVEIDWDSTGRTGSHTLFAVVDPEGTIDELSEANNTASRDMAVIGEGGIVMTTVLDDDQVPALRDVGISVKLENSGEAREVKLAVAIEDESGSPAATLSPETVSLPYASSRDFNFIWNTGRTFDGSYRVHSILTGSGGVGVLSENTAPFSILPDTRVDATITTDKTTYESQENVYLTVAVASLGKNHIISLLAANMTITDPGGTVVFSESRQLTDVLPGALNNLDATWNTGLSAPGAYIASVEITADGAPVSSKTTGFTLASHVLITGSIASVPSTVVFGSNARLDYAVQNNGNADAVGLSLEVLVIDPESGAVVSTGEETVNLPMNGSHTGSHVLSTKGLALKTYTAALRIVHNAVARRIADTAFTVTDGTPPVLNVVSPAAAQTCGVKVRLAVAASDDISGLSTVEYRIDDQEWRALLIADPYTGRYGTTWVPDEADEGSRIVSFRASDKAGNTSRPVSVAVTVDLTAPLSPVVISPENNSLVAAETVDIAGTAEPGTTVAMSFSGVFTTEADASSGAFAFTGVRLAPGLNTLTFTATDKAGNVSEASVHSLSFIPLTSRIEVNKLKYRPFEDVAITSAIGNTSSTAALKDFTARVSVENSQGQRIFTEDKALQEIKPQETAELHTTWNAAVSPKGQYSAKLEVLNGSTVAAPSSAVFEILGTSETGEGLKGTMTAAPNPVWQGDDETVAVSVRNEGNEDVEGLVIKVVIVDCATQQVKTEYATQKKLARGETVDLPHIVPTASLAPGSYSAILKVSTSTMQEPKTLADASFEVKPGLEVTQSIPDVINLLVWVDKKCSKFGGHKEREPACDDDECIRVDLIEGLLNGFVTDYRIVYDRKDFQRELRNPYFTDYLILGDHEHLEDHYADELKEQIYAGKGLMSSISLPYWKTGGGQGNPLLGVLFKGLLPGDHHRIELLESPLADGGQLDAEGSALRVEVLSGATVAGWIKSSTSKHSVDGAKTERLECNVKSYPALVLNGYGEGKTVLYTFDLGLTLNDDNYDQLSPIIRAAITYVHKENDAVSFLPTLFAPIETRLRAPSSAFDVKIKEAYSSDLRIYDSLADQWVRDNPWTRTFHVDSGQTTTVLSYALTPDETGMYTVQTETGYMANGVYSFYKSLNTDIMVGKDRLIVRDDIITALNSLEVSGNKDKTRVKQILKYITGLKNGPTVSNKEIEKNIQGLLTAVEILSNITSCDIKSVRLMMDGLLMSWEGQLYFYGMR